jgi:PIN domain nuclease of toxin-antitoxin system
VRLLLDTHIAIWAIIEDPRLSRTASSLIDNEANEIFVSAGSLWEISIKHALGRNGVSDMPFSSAEALGYFTEAGYHFLEVTPLHAVKVEELPLLHSDPFDRLLIAQSLAEPLRLVTHDQRVSRYSDSIILV